MKTKLTMISQIIVEQLKQWKAVPAVWCLLFDHMVHVNSEQRPKDLLVLDQELTKPCERL